MPSVTSKPPALAVLDVNETLSDLSGLAPRLEKVGAPAEFLPVWFDSTLRDGFAITAAGGLADFASIGVAMLAAMLANVEGLQGSADEAAEHIVASMADLDLHPDVAPGLRALAEAGVRVVTLSNGAAGVAESLLERAGLREFVEQCLSVSGTGRWKPAPEAYAYAARHCAVDHGDAMLIAVHPWDIDGARRAGLRSGWISRDAGAYPPFFLAPEVIAPDLPALAATLTRGQ